MPLTVSIGLATATPSMAGMVPLMQLAEQNFASARLPAAIA